MKQKWRFSVIAVSAAAMASIPAVASAAAGSTQYVAPNGHDSNPCTRVAPCRTISHAVSKASAGQSVSVAPGSYREHVVLNKKIQLVAQAPGTVIDASGALNGVSVGIQFTDPNTPKLVGNASGSSVRGFTVENARQEGILAFGSDLGLTNNIVVNNDRGARAAHPAGECAGEGQVPGDCGEGIHLAGVTHSSITGNYVSGNEGGILVSDEFGPTAFDNIAHNSVVNNVPDCGITLAAHNGNAVSPTGRRQPTQGGVYRNQITGNVVNSNGAAGIGFFAGGPGTGSYDNLAEGNSISSNGIPGIAIHTHPGPAPSDANGNLLIGNSLSRNGLGEGGQAPPGDPGTPVNKTTDIDVVADPGATPINGTLIQNNRLSNAAVGIWLVTSGHTTLSGNTFNNIGVPVRRG